MDPGSVLATIPKIIATHTGKLAYNYLAGHVKARIERNWKLMSKDMREKATPDDPLRNDWFAENEVLNNRIPFRLLEKTIREISNDSAERKSPHIAKFWVNICLTSNSDIDEATAFSYFETIESWSWRQLCIIRLISLLKDQKVTYEAPEGNDVKQMSKNERTSFHSISRDFGKLADAHYIQYVSMTTDGETHELYASYPGLAQLSASTDRLHSLMNLDDIPKPDIFKTFLPWKVRPRKPEECHV